MARVREAAAALFRAAPDDDRYYDVLRAASTTAGVGVSAESAMGHAAVLACVRVLSESLAQIPLHLYRRDQQRKERAPEHPLYALLHDAPNPEITSSEFRQFLMAQILLHNRGYAEIERRRDGRILALWPLLAPRMQERGGAGGREYVYQAGAQSIPLKPQQVLKIPGVLWQGINQKLSLVDAARESIGLGLAGDKFAAFWFANGSHPSGVLQLPQGKTLQPERRSELKRQWQTMHGGLSHSQRLAVLEDGLSYTPIGVTPKDAQALEARKYQVEEVARVFRVPKHLIGDLSNASFSNITQQSLEFTKFTLGPWLAKWEQRLTLHLLTPTERENYFIEFLTAGLERSDIQTRMDAYTKAIQYGILSPDEARDAENRNPWPEATGDQGFVPVNLMPLSQASSFPSAPGAGPDSTPGPAPTNAGSEEDASVDGDRDTRARLSAERRAATAGRRRLREAYRPLLRERFGQAARRDAGIIRKAMGRLLSRAAGDLAAWLAEEYEREALSEILGLLRGVVTSYSASVWDAAAAEIAEEASGDSDQWAAEYADRLAAKWISSSRGQLQAIIRDHEGDLDELEAVLDQRLTEWTEKRGDKEAGREAVNIGAAGAMAAWQGLGRSRVVWVTSNPCPLCDQFDGMIQTIGEPFVEAGAEVQPTGERPDGTSPERLTAYEPVVHPQLHAGCECDVSAA